MQGKTNLFFCLICGAKGYGPGDFLCHHFDPILTGKIETKNGTYVFRNDTGFGNEFWAWNIYDDPSRGTTHKWSKLPKGVITLFDLDDPPRSVGYLPVLGTNT